MVSKTDIWIAYVKETPKWLWESLIRNYRYSHHHVRTLALFAVIGEPFYHVVWRVLEPNSYETFPLRMLGALIAVPLLFARKGVRRGYESSLAVVFAIAVTYCLPFLFCFLLLQNAFLAEKGETSIIWPMQYTVSLVLLVLLFPSGVLAGMFFCIATAAAWGLFALLGGTVTPEVIRVFWGLMPIYLFILAAGTVFNANREVIDQARFRAMSDVVSNIAHELRTPLLGVKALARGIGMHLPVLIRSYDLAIQHQLGIERIRKRQLERLRTSLREIEVETDYSNVIIDRLLINTSEKPLEDHEFEDFTAQQCVIDALHRYPFAGAHERDLITVDLDRNFTIHAPVVLVVHVLFNLMKNGIYYVQKAGKGDLTVKILTGRRRRPTIIVEDTGTGIPPQNLRRIFDRFYTTSENEQGSGIGLSFCKTVMEGLGGSIKCDSELGLYTRFTLTFPPVRHA